MAIAKKHAALIALMAWLFLLAFIAVQAPGTSPETWLYLGFLGLLIITELLETQYARPAYLNRLQYMVWAGIGLVAAAVILSILQAVQ